MHYQLSILYNMSKDQKSFLDALVPLEEDFMRSLWSIGEDSEIRVIQERMENSQSPYTTIASVANKLEQKGYVQRVGKKRGFLYHAEVSQSDYYNHTLKYVVSNFFKGSYKSLIQHFAAEQNVSKDEIEEVLKMIEDESEE